MYRDAHHILHQRQEWTLRPDAKRLRETPSLVPRIDRLLHEEIHRECPPVPLLGFYALQRTLRAFDPTPHDTLASMEGLMSAIETASAHPKAHGIEKSLSQLAVQAIDLQRPYIASYVNRPTIIDLSAA